jgi:DNA repair exonuclease SbcCD ATPase subunit
MRERLKEFQYYYQQQRGAENNVIQSIGEISAKLDKLEKLERRTERAREVIRAVAKKTQDELRFHISDITSLALEAVFDTPYELKVDFVQRRNKTECDLLFVREGKEIEPLESSGYGVADVASFALRIASWSMNQNRSREIMILDEPFRFLSQDRQAEASRMLKEISEKLDVQFIIVTHEDILSQWADAEMKVTLRKGKSKVV